MKFAPQWTAASMDMVPSFIACASGSFDVVVLPGGAQGAEHLAASPLVGRHLKTQWQRGRLVGAICAAPVALLSHEIGLGSPITSHPSVADRVKHAYEWSDARVVEAGPLVTSQGPGTSFEFALRLVRRLLGAEVEQAVAGPLRLPDAARP